MLDAVHVSTAFRQAALLMSRRDAATAAGDRAPQSLADRKRGMHRQGGSSTNVQAAHRLLRFLSDLLLDDERWEACDARCISTVMWSMVKMRGLMGNSALAIKLNIVRHAIGRLTSNEGEVLQTAAPQGLANIIWSCGKLGCYDDHLCALAAEAACRVAPQFTNLGLTSLMYGYAALGHREPPLLTAVAQQVMQRSRSSGGNREQAAEGGIDQDCSKGVVKRGGGREAARGPGSGRPADESFQDQQITSLLWAFAKLNYRDAALFRQLQRKVRS